MGAAGAAALGGETGGCDAGSPGVGGSNQGSVGDPRYALEPPIQLQIDKIGVNVRHDEGTGHRGEYSEWALV